MSKRKSSGREPFIYRAHDPTELQGVHTDLIASSLKPGEKPVYLFYSPLWDGDRCCFGISSAPASHAVAVTRDCFIVSRDFHIEGNPPSLYAIPFDRILSVELGAALLLGWLSILFVENGRVSRLSILFKTIGFEHYAAAVREYRAVAGVSCPHAPKGRRATPTKAPDRRSMKQERKVRHLILERERIISAIHSPRLWGREKRLWKFVPVCIAGDSMLLMTDLGLLFAADETDLLPEVASYGVNVWCIPHDAVRAASIIEQTKHYTRVRFLRLGLGRDSASTFLDVPFDQSCGESACNLAEALNTCIAAYRMGSID